VKQPVTSIDILAEMDRAILVDPCGQVGDVNWYGAWEENSLSLLRLHRASYFGRGPIAAGAEQVRCQFGWFFDADAAVAEGANFLIE